MLLVRTEADRFAPVRSDDAPLFHIRDTVVGHYRYVPVSTPDFLATELAESTVTHVHLPASPQEHAWPTYDVLTLVYLDQYVDYKTDYNVPETDLMLVRRGNPWKHLHGAPPAFTSVHDEARFWLEAGDVREVRRPFGAKRWTRPLLIKALEKGTIDTWRGQPGAYAAYRFNDREVSERVRAFHQERMLE